MLFVFFFKQKTAYEMRISDWSSALCSSDLEPAPRAAALSQPQPPERKRHPHRAGQSARHPRHAALPPKHPAEAYGGEQHRHCEDVAERLHPRAGLRHARPQSGDIGKREEGQGQPKSQPGKDRERGGRREAERSEEHTSELQSLMRISYAVFCLKKKTNHNSRMTQHSTTIHL